MINTWLGEERLVAFDLPGTTRDAITVPFEYKGSGSSSLTPPVCEKGQVFEAIEKFSVVKTLQAIESAHVVLLLIDATQGVTDQDAHIADTCWNPVVQWWSPSTSGMPSTNTNASW